MAVIKVATKTGASLGRIIKYVTRDEKVKSRLMFGWNVDEERALESMILTKKSFRKEDGRQYKHYIQSFHKDEKITPEMALDIAIDLISSWEPAKDFECLVTVHQDKDHVHTHFILNSVSFVDGHKINLQKNELQNMKNISDQICEKNGLSITEKGKTFEGLSMCEKEKIVAYDKDAYQVIKKAEQNKTDSYVQHIYHSILDVLSVATSKEEFIDSLEQEYEIGVNWTDKRKHITFVDRIREADGEKKCKIRNSKLGQYYSLDLSAAALTAMLEHNRLEKEKEENSLDKMTSVAAQEIERDNEYEDMHKGIAIEPFNIEPEPEEPEWDYNFKDDTELE